MLPRPPSRCAHANRVHSCRMMRGGCDNGMFDSCRTASSDRPARLGVDGPPSSAGTVVMPARYEDLPKAARRRLLRRALLRPTVTAGALFLLYFGLPLDRQFSVLTLFTLLGGLLVFIGLLAFQARAIMRSPYPRLTAVESLAFSVPLFVVLFSVVYFLMAGNQPEAFTQPLTRLDALYFTVTVLTTVGFGDIVARTEPARALATIQMLADLLLLGLGARVLIGAAQSGLASRPGPSADDSPAQAPTADEGQRPP